MGGGSQARAGGELGAGGAWAGRQCSEDGRPGWGWFSWEERKEVGWSKWIFLGLLLHGLLTCAFSLTSLQSSNLQFLLPLFAHAAPSSTNAIFFSSSQVLAYSLLESQTREFLPKEHFRDPSITVHSTQSQDSCLGVCMRVPVRL